MNLGPEAHASPGGAELLRLLEEQGRGLSWAGPWRVRAVPGHQRCPGPSARVSNPSHGLAHQRPLLSVSHPPSSLARVPANRPGQTSPGFSRGFREGECRFTETKASRSHKAGRVPSMPHVTRTGTGVGRGPHVLASGDAAPRVTTALARGLHPPHRSFIDTPSTY